MPSYPATQEIIGNIANLPNLTLSDDPGAATHFNPTLGNTLAQLAWNYGAIAPVGTAAAGLWYLNRKPKPKKPALKVHAPAATEDPAVLAYRRKAAADINETLAAIRHHLPKLRVPDTVAGMAAGGGAGLLWDLLRGSGKDEQGKKLPSKRLRRVLAGALAGAGVSNLAGDRLRRYIANSVYPVNYAGSGPKATKARELIPGTRFDPVTGAELTGAGGKEISRADALADIYRGAILDKPNYKVAPIASSPNISDHILSARRELVRRSFGLPLDMENKANPYWEKRRGGYYSLNENSPEYSSRLRALYGPTKPVYLGNGDKPHVNYSTLLRHPAKTFKALNTAKDYRDEEINTDFSLFGGPQINGAQQVPYKVNPDGTISGQALDRWDMTLSGKEQKVFNDGWQAFRTGGIAGFKDWAGKPAERVNKYVGPGNATNATSLKTLANRLVWDKVLTDENPWVQQKFQLTHAPEKSWGEWFASSSAQNSDHTNSPYRLQFLQDNGAPATPEMSTQMLKKWVGTIPPPPVNRIPRVTDNLKKK